MKKIIWILFLFLIIQNNAFASAMDKVMDSWVGENINTVIDSWGYPSTEKTISSRHLFYWSSSYYSISSSYGGIYGVKKSCNRIFEVDKKGKITKWEWNGNDCPAFYFFCKKLVNPNNDPWKIKKQQKKERRELRKIERQKKKELKKLEES